MASLVSSVTALARNGYGPVEDYLRCLILISCWRRLGGSVSPSFDEVLTQNPATREEVVQAIGRIQPKRAVFDGHYAPLMMLGPDLIKIMNMIASTDPTEMGSPFYRDIVTTLAVDGRSGYGSSYIPESLVQLMNEVTAAPEGSQIYLPGWSDWRWLPPKYQYFSDHPSMEMAFWSDAWTILSGAHVQHGIRPFLVGPNDQERPRTPFFAVWAMPPMGYRVDSSIVRDDPSGRYLEWTASGRPITGDLLFWWQALAYASTAVILCPMGPLFRAGYERDIRAKIVEAGYVEAVIQLPGNLLDQSSIPLVAVVLKKGRAIELTRSILFIDASQQFDTARRRNHLTSEHRTWITSHLTARQRFPGKVEVISLEAVRHQDCNLVPTRYMEDAGLSQRRHTLAQFQMKKVQDLAEVINPQLPSPKSSQPEPVAEVRVPDFPRAGFLDVRHLESAKRVDLDLDSDRVRRNLLKQGDVLLSSKGVIGRVAVVGDLEGQKAVASQTCHVVRFPDGPGKLEQALCLAMFFKSDAGQACLEPFVARSTLAHLSTKALMGFEVPVPTEEQRKPILAAFEAEQTAIEKIEQLESQIRALHSEFGAQ